MPTCTASRSGESREHADDADDRHGQRGHELRGLMDGQIVVGNQRAAEHLPEPGHQRQARPMTSSLPMQC
jgi:hypothetical protein